MAEPARKPVKKVKRVVRQRRNSYDSDIWSAIGVAFENVFRDVLMPSVKDMIFEGVTEGANRLIYREGTQARSQKVRKTGGRTNYSDASKSSFSKRDRKMMNFDRVVFDSRKEAQQVLENLYSALEQYGSITVADFYDEAGITSNQFTDDNWGWMNLRGSQVVRSGVGFALRLPDPQPLD